MREQVAARNLRVIVSGGGTGGHIFPAIAIADELARLRPGTEFLFVGAEGKMEMEKVPKAGYKIVGLPIRGLERKLTLANLAFPFKLLSSIWKSRGIIKQFKPDVVIGTGGYAGGPILYMAAKMGVPTLIQEPNAFAGLANKWVGKYVDKVCVAFAEMSKYFPAEKLVITGNPVREAMLREAKSMRADATAQTNSNVLLMGGSGGARSLNEAMAAATEQIAAAPDVFWTWQCGKHYYDAYKDTATAQLPNVRIAAFLDDMAKEYAKADIVIGRAGSTTIAEIQFLGKPAILVPSPWVTEDHQTMNAKALTVEAAAILLPDARTKEELVTKVLGLLNDPVQLAKLGQNAGAMAQSGAVTRIAEEALGLLTTNLGGNNVAPLAETSNEVYFIGIGGIGMSALARYFNSQGYQVSGYDRTETALTKALVKEGIAIHYTPQPASLPIRKEGSQQTLFIYTPAVPTNFPELAALEAAGVKVYKRSEVLGMISKDKDCIAIAGTHGKTTTTTLTTHLLRECGVDTNAFLGGIARNFNGNYVFGNSDWVTVEADEYDRSFLRLYPKQAVILSMDADHLDIYGTHEAMIATGFQAFAKQVDPQGCLVVRHDLAEHFSAYPATFLKTFGIEEGAYQASDIRVENGLFTFKVSLPDGRVLEKLQLPLAGRHNIENATAAIAMTAVAGGNLDKVANALLAFRGIARRFEIVLRTEDLVIVDDYAHHPTELTAAISAARELYPTRLIRGVFQPHLYSRTQDFAAGFAQALDLLDEAILLPIYPAREMPIAGVDSQLLLDKMESTSKILLEKDNLIDHLATQKTGVILMLGAGDIDALVPQVVNHFQKAPQS